MLPDCDENIMVGYTTMYKNLQNYQTKKYPTFSDSHIFKLSSTYKKFRVDVDLKSHKINWRTLAIHEIS